MRFIGDLFAIISLFGFVGIFKVTALHQKLKLSKRWHNVVVWIVAALIASPFLPKDQPQKDQPKQEAKPAQAASVQAQAQPAPKPQPKPQPAPQPKPQPVVSKPNPLPLDQAIKKAVTDAIGSETNDGKHPRIQNLMTLPDDNDEKATDVVIEVNADENLTAHMTAEGMLMDAAKIFPAIFPRGYIKKVVINFYYDMTDAYGQTSHENVLQIILTKDTYKKINWDNFDYKNFPNVADDFQADPAVQKALQEN